MVARLWLWVDGWMDKRKGDRPCDGHTKIRRSADEFILLMITSMLLPLIAQSVSSERGREGVDRERSPQG